MLAWHNLTKDAKDWERNEKKFPSVHQRIRKERVRAHMLAKICQHKEREITRETQTSSWTDLQTGRGGRKIVGGLKGGGNSSDVSEPTAAKAPAVNGGVADFTKLLKEWENQNRNENYDWQS